MNISKYLRAIKVSQLMKCEGYSDKEALLADATLDAVCHGICVNAHCTYTTEVEPDQEEGWCEICGGQTVVSVLVLEGLI
ncbi:MAG: hypothetical protein KIT43_06025 [Bauldia sp.]|nr:hypothetical protein [Bauldia sp.]